MTARMWETPRNNLFAIGLLLFSLSQCGRQLAGDAPLFCFFSGLGCGLEAAGLLFCRHGGLFCKGRGRR